MTRSDVTHMLVKQSSSLSMETLDFISPDLCPPSSPVVYRIWGLVQECMYMYNVCTCPRHYSDLKQRLIDTWACISQNFIDKVVGQCRKRRRASMKAK